MANSKIVVPPAALYTIHKELEKTKVNVGKHELNNSITFDIEGIVTKAKGGMYKPTVKIPWKKVCMILAKNAGFMGPKTLRMLTDAIIEATDSKVNIDELLEVSIEAEALFKEEVVSKMPDERRSGRTTWKGVVKVSDVVAR